MKATIKFLPFLLLFFAPVFKADAQYIHKDTLKALYEREAIYLHGSRWMKNDKKLKFGFMGKKLAPEFSISPEGQREFFIYRDKAKTSFLLVAASYAAYIGALFVVEQNPELSLGMMGSGLVLSGFSVAYSISAQKRLQKAIFYRNRDVLLQDAYYK